MKFTTKGICYGIQRMSNNMTQTERDDYLESINQHARNTNRRIMRARTEKENGYVDTRNQEGTGFC